MKIGMTGGTGFLGRETALRLLKQGHEVVAWCRDVSTAPEIGIRSSSGRMEHKVQWIQGRLGDDLATQSLVKECNAIVHAGLFQHGSKFVGGEGEPIAYMETNVIGSLKLLEAAANHGIDRFVFLSSGAVHDRVAEDRPLDEKHPLWPSSFYGNYKACVETMVHNYGLSGKLSCCSLRPTMIYGIADPIRDSRWYQLITEIAEGKNVQVTGGSKSVHVSDVAAAIELLLQTEQDIAGETYNCTDLMISQYTVAKIAKAKVGSQSIIKGEPKEAKYEMDTSKIKAIGMEFGGTAILESTIEQLLGLGDKR